VSPRHPGNSLNDLSGEEWLYFTKSVWGTAYPSELGHDRRKQHGANKPPRLMARLIEFFTTSGELVLDPFAGVGGTLLGAAIARGPRRAIGIEIEARWVAVYESLPCWPTSVRPIPAGRERSTPRAFPWCWATRWRSCRTSSPRASTSLPPTRPTTSSCR
jgi:hypothetical protein